jgi:hypothetical protein
LTRQVNTKREGRKEKKERNEKSRTNAEKNGK